MFYFKKAVGVVEGGWGVVDRAGTDDDEEATGGVGILDAGDYFVAAFENGVFGILGLWA